MDVRGGCTSSVALIGILSPSSNVSGSFFAELLDGLNFGSSLSSPSRSGGGSLLLEGGAGRFGSKGQPEELLIDEETVFTFSEGCSLLEGEDDVKGGSSMIIIIIKQ